MGNRISIVIPVFRAELSLKSLYERIVAAMADAEQNFECIFVEDGGGDRSWEIIEQLSAEDVRVKGIALNRNFGQHNALLCGIREASGDVIVTMDDDLQHPPDQIFQLVEELNRGFDVVYGAPKNESHSFFRVLASKSTKWVLQNTMGAQVASKVSAFRAFRPALTKAFMGYSSANVNIDVMLTWVTTRFSVVDVDHHDRQHGESGYTMKKLVQHAVNMMTGFSTIPLQIASIVGVVFSLFGAVILFYVIGRYFVTDAAVPGFPFLASIIAIFSGTQLLAIGIIGEYLARMYYRTMGKPPYVVKNKCGREA